MALLAGIVESDHTEEKDPMDPQQFLTELDSQLRSVIGTALAFAPATSDVTTTDDSGIVSVTLRPNQSLARVQVGANWMEEIEPSALASTILEVAGQAQAEVLGVGSDADPAEGADPVEVNRALNSLLEEKTAEMMQPVSATRLQQQIDDLPALLDKLGAQLDDAIEKTAKRSEDDLPQATSGRDDEDSLGDVVESENRMVSVQLFGGRVTDVRIKESWLESRSGIAVTQCFDQIIDRIAVNTNEQS